MQNFTRLNRNIQMDTDTYSLSDSYVAVGGAGGYLESFDSTLQTFFSNHYRLLTALILVLVVVIIYVKAYEHFSPTATLRFQKQDNLGWRENLDSTGVDRSKSYFAQDVQSGGLGDFKSAGQNGTSSWQVLHSSEFDCDKRQAVGDDAWAWMNGVSRESGEGFKPKTDNDFSRILSGN